MINSRILVKKGEVMIGLKEQKLTGNQSDNRFSQPETKLFADNPFKKQPTSVVVVEDEADIRELISYILESRGYQTISFENPVKAMAHLASHPVDIIVSDVMMPEMDGIEFCSQIKNKNKNTYFILLTAKGEKSDVTNGLNIGADDYIIKPFDFTEFIARVKAGERIVKNHKRLVYLNEQLEKMADTDGLTRLKNRRYFITHAQKELNRARRYNHTLAVLMIDIDHFKTINDTYGHLTGDLVLKKLARVLTKHARESDIISRYGGEEFVILIPETNPRKAYFTAEKLRKVIEKTDFTVDKNTISVTVSIGLALKTPSNDHTLETLIDKADKALYQAKNSGRNKSVIEEWQY